MPAEITAHVQIRYLPPHPNHNLNVTDKIVGHQSWLPVWKGRECISDVTFTFSFAMPIVHLCRVWEMKSQLLLRDARMFCLKEREFWSAFLHRSHPKHLEQCLVHSRHSAFTKTVNSAFPGSKDFVNYTQDLPTPDEHLCQLPR